MTTWTITARDGGLYVNVPDEWDNENTLLFTRSDEGEPIIPRRWNGDALGALYDLRQCSDAIKDGDEFAYRGRIVAKVHGIHVVPCKLPHRLAPPPLRSPSAGWVPYPNPPNDGGNFIEDLLLISSILGSSRYESLRSGGAWYIRRVED